MFQQFKILLAVALMTSAAVAQARTCTLTVTDKVTFETDTVSDVSKNGELITLSLNGFFAAYEWEQANNVERITLLNPTGGGVDGGTYAPPVFDIRITFVDNSPTATATFYCTPFSKR
jgi:hypothetical protein